MAGFVKCPWNLSGPGRVFWRTDSENIGRSIRVRFK